MQLDTIEIDRDEAKARLDEYTESLKHDRNSEDEAIARAYRAAARGLPIIRLSEAIHAGGYFTKGLPRLAIARADASRCWVRDEWARTGRTTLIYRDEPDADNRGALVGRYTVRVEVPRERSYAASGSTIVPIIPPRFRPGRFRIRGFHVLWEVEKWEPEPPKDPALVKHIGGDLWSVHAAWDLTELERAVLIGTR
jgi:hypothetical protein